jgi:hypothetical protein
MRTIVSTIAAAQALVGASMPPSLELLVLDNGFSQPARYLYTGASSAVDGNAGQLIIVPSGSVGRFVRSDPFVDLVLPATSATADAAVLSLIPAGVTLQPMFNAVMNEVITPWAGGTGAGLSLSFSIGTAPALNRTKGNLGGNGTTGDAGFTGASFYQPTLGSQWGGGKALQPVLSPGSQIFFDRYGVAFFTSGSSRFHVPCMNYATTITPISPP